MASLLHLLMVLLSVALYGVTAGIDDVRVRATAPVHPVEQDGIFSLRCQVWNLEQDQEVALVRIPLGGKTERLSLKENVVSVDERVFLAVRQLDDSSVVYFLSIMKIMRKDAGNYRCAVYGDVSGAFVELTSESITVKVMYFPESGPECEPIGNYAVMEGTDVAFNCSADTAFPTASLTWSRASPDTTIATEQSIYNGKTYTVLRLTPTMRDSGIVFLCTMTSTAFPGRQTNCHVGPLHVRANPNHVPSGGQTPRQNTPTTNIDNNVRADGTKLDQGPKDVANIPPVDCAQECSYTNSDAFLWVIATIIAAILAILFFLIGLVLLLKYCRLQESRKLDYTIARQHGDTAQIYAELDGRRGGEKVYMYLDKNPKMQSYNQTQSKELHQHYGIIPHVPKT